MNKTSNALEIIHREFFDGKPEMRAELEKARCEDAVARKIRQLRIRSKLSQRELAKLVKTTPSVISRLESADYEGHSMSMLARVAEALNRRVEIRFVTLKPKSTEKFQHA